MPTGTPAPVPEVLAKIPTPPLPLDRVARREWDRVAPELIRLHLLSKLDLAALAAYCTAFSSLVAARACIAKHGRYVKTRGGGLMASPAVWDLNRALETLRIFANEFGMSPASRGRVVTGGGGAPAEPRGGSADPARPPATNRHGEPI